MNNTPRKFSQATVLLSEELHKRGYECSEQIQDGKSVITCVSPDGRIWASRKAAAKYPFVSDRARRICKDKKLACDFVAKHGGRVPRTLAVSTATSEEIDAFLAANAPVIVKPLDSQQSRGLTLNVRTRQELDAAISAAKQYSHEALIQEFVSGQEVRITVLDGKVVSAILRQPPQVIGDGKSSLSQLIEQENKHRTKLTFEYLAYPQLVATLIDESLLHSNLVPADGEVVQLSHASMISKGASFYGITKVLHQDYKDLAERLVGALNPDFLVIDILLTEYTAPLREDNCAFLEFNVSPALKAYYCVRDGDVYDAIASIADKIESYK